MDYFVEHWQQFTSLGIVALAAAYLVKVELKKYRIRKTRTCGQDCGCSTAKFKVIDQK